MPPARCTARCRPERSRTTFTASQGLLLMLPNMFKIAGELTPAVIHVAARAIATHALSIFGDHSDVMAARTTGFAMLCASSVQEAHDFAAVSHAATLRARVPFLHFFDGFRTSHEINRIELLDDDDLRALIDDDDIAAHKLRRLRPTAPVVRGTAQNPDVFFQAREAANPFHDAVPGIVDDVFAELAERTGRRYGLVDYEGAPDAERVIVMMGSGSGAVGETVAKLVADGEKVGLATIRLFRPFPSDALLAALPDTVRSIAVLDRTKEPGSVGEPLFQDVVTTLAESGRSRVRVIGGRYGLGSKEFTPAMAKAVFDELTPSAEAPLHRRHRRRRHRAQPRRRRLVPVDRAGRSGGVLRARQRRHGRREQGIGQDHRPRTRPLRPGLLRLRLEEVGLDDRVAPALRPEADPLDLPRAGGRPRRLPPVRAARPLRRARRRPPRRHVPPQRALSGRRGLGAPARAIQRASSTRSCASSRSTPPGSPRGRRWPAGSTRSCSRASSRSPT